MRRNYVWRTRIKWRALLNDYSESKEFDTEDAAEKFLIQNARPVEMLASDTVAGIEMDMASEVFLYTMADITLPTYGRKNDAFDEDYHYAMSGPVNMALFRGKVRKFIFHYSDTDLKKQGPQFVASYKAALLDPDVPLVQKKKSLLAQFETLWPEATELAQAS